jgi:RNA polymerase sigma-70 factor (ECF subfamily)
MTRQDSAARAQIPPGARPPEPAGAPSADVSLPSFESTYQQYFDFVWASALRLGVSSAAIDDVVQEIFIVIAAKLVEVRQPQSLRSWIYGVVRRTVSDHHRSQRTKTAFGAVLAQELEVQRPSTPTPLDLTEQGARVRLLWSLLEGLDPIKREIFVLAELEEMSAPEIAEALEIPLNTAYSRLRAARQAFEEGLARDAARQGGKA